MSGTESIKVAERDKGRLDTIKEEYPEYGELSYAQAVEMLIDKYENKDYSDTSGGSDVTRTMEGGDSDPDEGDEFRGDGDTLTAEERAEKFRQ